VWQSLVEVLGGLSGDPKTTLSFLMTRIDGDIYRPIWGVITVFRNSSCTLFSSIVVTISVKVLEWASYSKNLVLTCYRGKFGTFTFGWIKYASWSASMLSIFSAMGPQIEQIIDMSISPSSVDFEYVFDNVIFGDDEPLEDAHLIWTTLKERYDKTILLHMALLLPLLMTHQFESYHMHAKNMWNKDCIAVSDLRSFGRKMI
ncbi:hypothetical protein ACJX0J_012657, partial [Zea mays]